MGSQTADFSDVFTSYGTPCPYRQYFHIFSIIVLYNYPIDLFQHMDPILTSE